MTTERVGRYQLLEPIGVGPSGSVSRAKVFGVAGFERQFAVKRFHAELTTTAAMAQALSAAARAYGGLEHPRIARMSEFGVAQGTTFTAVEYVAGLDALRLIAEARLSGTTLAAGGALALVSQAARAVGYAHGRGLTHLGLSPTNVIVTAEGDVKITDFGILSATLPQKPIEMVRLAQRIQYLAPEQLANEATSAATDVFALGVLAYELVTGQRTFRGETPQQVAQSVMGGPPAEPPLPRPIVRVLQRCLARSPFERFPDARALADALDAALRVAPVPGTRKDIGSQVKQTLDRLAELHSGELSGMVALNVGTANLLRGPSAPVVALGMRDSQDGLEFSTTEFVRPDTPVAGPTPLVGPASRPTRAPGDLDEPTRAGFASAASTFPDLPKAPYTTVAGIAPPPIPVPPGLASPPGATPPPSGTAPSTLLGIANASKPPPAIPPVRPVLGAVPPPKTFPRPIERPPPLPSGPPDRPSETAVSPLRMMDALPTAAPMPTLAPRGPAKPPAMPRLDGNRQLFGALRPATDEPDKARTDLVIETEPGDLPDPETIMSSESLSVEMSIVEGPSESLSVEMSIVDGPSEEDGENEDDETRIRPPSRAETNQMSPLLVEQLGAATSRPLDESVSLVANAWADLSQVSEDSPPPRKQDPTILPARPASPSRQPSGREATPAPSHSQQVERNVETMDVRVAKPPRSRLPWILGGVVGALALGVGAYFAIDMLGGDDKVGGTVVARRDGGTADAQRVAAVDASTGEPDAPRVVTAPVDAGKTAAADALVATAPIDAGRAAPADAQVAMAPIDAGRAVPADAQVAKAPLDAGKPVAGADSLAITSTPAGARVFIDGADAGVTPLKLPGTPDRHTVALLLPGHELYVAQVDGHGAFSIPLKDVTPTNGPAGIKVLKCKDKDRYYVFVDSRPTGQTCPTERIGVEIGPHIVEVYDVVSETRRKWEIDIKDTRLSYRVKID